MRKTHTLLLIFAAFILTLDVAAQVTIGSGDKPGEFSILELSTATTKGGLRLPHLTSIQRDALDLFSLADDEAKNVLGLTIYNTTTKCVEYWNNTKWISLCTGQANIYFEDLLGTVVDPTETPFNPNGEERQPLIPKDNPNCTGQIPPFDFVLITGGEFAQVTVMNNSTGEFVISMNPNPTARPRTAILRVTNNCTAEYSEFIFGQEGAQVCIAGADNPKLKVNGSEIICKDGAVYMYIDNPQGHPYVWTLNDAELRDADGKNYYWATQPGTYRVYVGGIGCPQASDRLVLKKDNSSVAESGVGSIIASNNGVICGPNNKVTLTALDVPENGTLAWYKEGKHDPSKTTRSIELGQNDIGDWFAVMQTSGCSSEASNIISVEYDENSTPLTSPIVKVNGELLAAATFCKGGYLKLELDNYDSYAGIAVEVKWYNGTKLLGTGKVLETMAPNDDSFILRCIVSDKSGDRCDAEVLDERAMTSTAPKRPAIYAPIPYVCGPSPASLTATGGLSIFKYKWYQDGEWIQGAESDKMLYKAENSGKYKVQMKDDNMCISAISAETVVKISDISIVQFINPLASVELESTHTFQALGSHDPIAYEWSIEGDAILIDQGTTGNTMRVKFPDYEATITLKLRVENACGYSETLTHEIKVLPDCTPITNVKTTMNPTGTIIEGTPVSMSVTASGSFPRTYVWARNTAALPGDASTYNIDAADNTKHSGDYTVTVSNGCPPEVAPVAVGNLRVINAGSITEGSGTLSGESCFDLVLSPDNFTEECGLESNREKFKADFTTAQRYIFRNSGTGNKNLTFIIHDPNKLVKSTTLDPSIPAIGTAMTNAQTYYIDVLFDKEEVERQGIGTSEMLNGNGLKLKIYAIYNTSTGAERQANKDILIQDCQCCGGGGTPGTVVGRTGNKYLTHRYGDVCWMVSNSKEPGFLKQYYGSGNTRQNGYYYKFDKAAGNKFQATCPIGWRLPSKTEFENMIKFAKADSKIGKWWTIAKSNAFAGQFMHYGSSTDEWVGWQEFGFYWVDGPYKDGFYKVDYRANITHTYTSMRANSIRCVKIE